MSTSQPITKTTIESPIGDLTLTAIDGVLSGVYMHRQRHRPQLSGAERAGDFTQVVEQLHAYFDGTLTEFELPLRIEGGSEFQRRVWSALSEIPYGETISYGELARRLGSPEASRAVGLANGRNPIAIVVPCHRVIGANGSLTGYGGGLERKRWLLDHELAHCPIVPENQLYRPERVDERLFAL